MLEPVSWEAAADACLRLVSLSKSGRKLFVISPCAKQCERTRVRSRKVARGERSSVCRFVRPARIVGKPRTRGSLNRVG